MTSSNTTTIGVVVHLGSGHDRPPVGARRVPRNIGFLGLVSKLHQIFKTDCNKYALKISGALRDNNEVQLIPINDDDDLWFFFAPEAENRTVSLYVVTEQLQPNASPEISSNAPAEISPSNEYYQYASYLMSDDIDNSVINDQGVANIEVEQCATGEDFNDTWQTSIRKLPKLMGAIQKWNIGTIVEWKHMSGGTDHIEMLKYVFWAFKPCIDGFEYCRKVISVDATQFHSKYKYKLLIATTVDANESLLPLAYAIVDEENIYSWTWFIRLIAIHVVRGGEGMCLISNTHPSVLEAVKRVPLFQPPNGVHRLCLRHVCTDFNTKVENLQLKNMCWAAGSASTCRDFENVMNQMRSMNQMAYDYLQNINKSQWTFAYDGGWRKGVLTTDLTQCMYGMLRGARRFPICEFVQLTFSRSMEYFHERLLMGCAMQQRNQPLPYTVYIKYKQMQRNTLHHHIYKADVIEQSATLKTFVPGSTAAHTDVVKLQQRECSCGQWRQSGIPCSHAMQTIRHFGRDPTTFMMPFYNISSFIGTYSGKFVPIPDEIYWEEPSFKLCDNPAMRERLHKRRHQTTRYQHEIDGSQSGAGQRYHAHDHQDADRLGTSRHH